MKTEQLLFYGDYAQMKAFFSNILAKNAPKLTVSYY